jgi:type I restriction enzyme S subunit
MMNYQNVKKYPAYKDSGVEWIGEIPVGWKLKKLGNILNPISIKNHPEMRLLSITREKGVIERDVDNQDENHNYIPEDLSGYKVLKKGQFGMNKMKAWQGSYGVSKHNGIVSPAYYVFKISRDLSLDFFHTAIRSTIYVSFFGRASDGVRIGQWDLSKTRMKNIPLLLPPLPEQIAIANFLDEKCNKIDKAVAQKEKLVALLKERKQIVIQNAVTKGLNPNAKMKDSRVEWIGEIPEGWEVQRLASFGKFTKGGGFSKSDLQEKGERAILYGDIYTIYDYFFIDAKKFISSNNSKKSSEIKKGDLLFTGSGETLEDIGKCVAFYGNKKTYAGGDIIIFKQSRYNSLYLSYALNSELLKQEKAKTAKGEIIVHTYASKLKNIYIPIPSLNIQAAIVSHIKTQSQKINKAITLQQNQIEKLKEYKSILINNAVTGKIKVC